MDLRQAYTRCLRAQTRRRPSSRAGSVSILPSPSPSPFFHIVVPADAFVFQALIAHWAILLSLPSPSAHKHRHARGMKARHQVCRSPNASTDRMLHDADMFAPAKSMDKRSSVAANKGGIRRVTINEANEGEGNGKTTRRARAAESSSFP